MTLAQIGRWGDPECWKRREDTKFSCTADKNVESYSAILRTISAVLSQRG